MPEGSYTMLKPTNGVPYWTNYEPKEGAYYYVCGGSVATYKKASATIILPTSYKLKGTGTGRNAYISIGVDGGAAGAIDIGIRNRTYPDYVRQLPGDGDDGFGWEPYCLETNPSVGHYFENNRAPFGTKKAKVEVTPNLTSRNKVSLSVQWLNGSNNIIDASKNLNTEIELTKNFTWTSFFRFASLVTDDANGVRNDSTYMLGGGFDSVKLGNTNWGITSNLVDRAWIINHPKCQLPYGYWDTGEEFSIDHWA